VSWALELAPEDAASLRALRLEPGVEVHVGGGRLWLRGPRREGLAARLLTLPARRRYQIDGERLLPLGARLAVGAPPPGPWVALDTWLAVEVGELALSAERPPSVVLRVVPAPPRAAASPTLLCTSAPRWRRWASTASAVRLARLRFAVARDGRVLVRGDPLPPLPGDRWLEAGGVAVPCGYAWDPPVDASTCAVALGLLPGDLALLHPDGDHERLDASAFVVATRAAALASTQDADDA
jgi:hypothetical protein